MRSRRFRGRWRLAALVLFIIVVVLLAYGVGETYWIDVAQYTFASPDVPESFDDTKIVLLTDIHRGPFFSQDRVRSLVERVNALDPDVVVLGGDYVYMSTDYAASCFAELAALSALLGRYAVLGNHDYGDYHKGEDGPNPVIAAIEDAGITLLREEAVWLERNGARVRLGGVSDSQVDRPRFTPTVEGTTTEDLVILASHNPDYSEELPAQAVDLVLSGHTHGGQVAAFGKWAFYVPSEYGQKYRTGLVKNDVTTVIVSNGIGTSTIPPIRLCARPQIVVITLERGTATVE